MNRGEKHDTFEATTIRIPPYSKRMDRFATWLAKRLWGNE